MFGIKFKCGGVVELMEHVGPCYSYGVWIRLAQYMQSMQRYAVFASYIQLKDSNQST